VEGELSFAERTRRLESIYDALIADRNGTRRKSVAPHRAGVAGA